MVGEIKLAFEENLKYVSWMDAETKTAAKEKVGGEKDVLQATRKRKKNPALPPGVKTQLSHPFIPVWIAGGRHIQHGGLPRLHHERHQPGQGVQ